MTVELEPPWAAYPWIIRGSIGWRMGCGESYSMQWADFVRELPSADAFVAYLQRHPQAPRTWRDSLASWLGHFESPDGKDDIDEESPQWARLLARVDAAALVGDDVAYPVWLRNLLRAGGMTAPWTWRGGGDPDDMWRYSTREVGWWCRWIGEGSIVGYSIEWLQQQQPPAAWAAIFDDLIAGRAGPSWTRLDAGAARLIAMHASIATLKPPWLGGHPPIDDIEFDGPAVDDRHRWAWWVMDTFEDAATWGDYLARWPPPADWRHVLDATLFADLAG